MSSSCIFTVDSLAERLRYLSEAGFGDSPVYLSMDEECNGFHPAISDGCGVMGCDDYKYFGIPNGSVVIS